MLVCATLFWAGNFTLAKLAYLENIPPNSLAFLRWCLVWIILLPFTYKEILKLKNQIKGNLSLFLILGSTSVCIFTSFTYNALNYTQVINASLFNTAIPVTIILVCFLLKIEKTNIFQISGLLISVLGILASSIERFAVEIRNLQKTEVLEVEESFSSNQKGSSAMPHKRNPVLSENLTGISRYIRSGVIPSLENVVLWHERDISHSSVERIMTPDITIATDFALNRLNGIIKNLKVYPKNMLKNLNMLGGLHRTHNIMLKLIEKGLKRQQAYKIVQESAMETWNNNKNFSQVLQKNKELNKKLNSKEIEKIIKDDNDLKKIDWIFKNKIK